MRIKRTRMIVITKNRIVVFLCLILSVSLTLSAIFLVDKTASLQAFSHYESIISKQLLPEKKNSKKSTHAVNLLCHIFKFSMPEDTPEKAITVPSASPAPLIESEKLTIKSSPEVRNATAYYVNINEYLSKKLSFSSNANILIMHTHTTESFAQMQYAKDAPDRNLDENCNMIAVGRAMLEVFGKNNIKACHDTTVHDYPSYNSSYQKAFATIEKNLKNDNSINIVLDIHRDGITRDDGTKVGLVTDINGVKTAQIMLVVGTDTNLEHKNWQENLAFAVKIQQKADELYPGLMRPIDLRKERFNQQLTKGSLIIEVGANGNTLEEALEGAKAIAQVISEVVR